MPCKTYAQRLHYARRRRERMVRMLGAKCAYCGKTEKLEFDHINPALKTWSTERVGFFYSLTLYWRDYLAGNIQLLCRSCNAKKSDHRIKPQWQNDVAIAAAWFKRNFGGAR